MSYAQIIALQPFTPPVCPGGAKRNERNDHGRGQMDFFSERERADQQSVRSTTSSPFGDGTPKLANGKCASRLTSQVVNVANFSASQTSPLPSSGAARERNPIPRPNGTTTKPTSGTMIGLATNPASERWPK